MSKTPALADRNAFVSQLLQLSRQPDITTNRFVQAVHAGRCPHSVLQAYAQAVVRFTTAFVPVLAQVFAVCEHAPSRQLLLGNLLEEEGVQRFIVGQGLVVDRTQRHSELAGRFAQALGVINSAPSVHADGNQWLADCLARGNWIGPFSYLSIGFEANVPPTCALLADGLSQHYGLDASALAFFHLHMEADVRHSEQAAHMIADAARCEGARQQALDGAAHGAKVWWHLHQIYARQMAALQKSPN